MKITFPNYDGKRGMIFRDLKVGDELYQIGLHGWQDRYYIMKLTVKKITPKGYLRMSNDELWKELIPNGVYLKDDVLSILEDIRIYNDFVSCIDELVSKNRNNKLSRYVSKDEAKEVSKIITEIIGRLPK